MSTAAQAIANRVNALRSSGPKSEAGKAVSKLNSVTHGLTSKQIVLPHENREEYEALHSAFQQDYKPATDTERELVTQMADAWWRLQRAKRVETSFLTKAMDNAGVSDDALADMFLDTKQSAQLRLFMRYLSAAERAWNKALADFNQTRKQRAEEAKAEAKNSLERIWINSIGFASQSEEPAAITAPATATPIRS